MIVLGETNIGLVRPTNQDAVRFGLLGAGAFLCVCDGMGGAGGGAASELSAGTIETMLRRDLPAPPFAGVREVFLCAAAAANSEVCRRWQAEPALRGMGSTMVLALCDAQTLYLSSVGDSRAYLLEGETLTLLTHDHTVVQMLIDSGEITPAEASVHPKRHYITRALGIEREVEAAYLEHPFPEGALLLLCSDGLYNYVPESALPALMRRAFAEGSVRCLIDAANAGGGGDNITAALLGRAEGEGL